MYNRERSTDKDSLSRRSSCSELPNMTKTRSVDFARMQIANRTNAVASQFSQRAARGSFKDLRDQSGSLLDSYGSDCSLNRKRKHVLFTEADPLLQPQTDLDWPLEEEIDDDDRTSRFSISIPRFSLAKLSMFFLAFATAFDMALTNMRGADEIGRPRASLGSAAISAVTTSLSPILPFAGGLDLRRDDYWSVSADGNWFGTLQSVVSQVQDAFSGEAKLNDRDRRNSLKSGRMLSRPQTPRQTKNHVLAIAAQQPFVQLDVISQLTLGDIGQCFNYAMISSDVDFNAARFLSGLSSNLQTVIQALQESVARSHGSGVNEWIRSPDEKSDPATSSSIDALKFSAAMRVFAEWRVLRQVPPGYKGFAMGMSLGHKDVVQNIIKMEEAVHGWIDYQQGLCELNDPSCQGDLRTPTLRDLLQYELDSGLHPSNRLPTLKEKSAGMGLLWVRRQLAYQTQIFDNVLSMNDGAGAKSSMKEAVGAAYMHVYGQYHGWAVQKIFNYSFQAAPEAEEILRFMNPHRLQELMQEQRKHLHKSESGSCESDSHQLSNQNPVQQLANHVGGEWDKFAFNVVKIFNKNAEPPEIVATCDGVGALEESGAVDEAHITREMVKDAHQQIASYLTVAEPLLGSLATMFDDLNMDDPTRV